MGMNEEVCDLMAENGNMKMLLNDLLPHLEARIYGLKQSYCGGQNEISECIRANEDMIRRAREFLHGFEVPNDSAQWTPPLK
jgi:hypothetical protein